VYQVIIVAVLAYGIGSFQIGKALKSKRMRFTCVASVYCDIAKGFAVVAAASSLGNETAAVAVLAVMLGHIFPIHQKVDNCGIGVTLGAIAAFDPILGLIALASWMFVQYVFMHSIAAVLVSILVTVVVCAVWIDPMQSGIITAFGMVLLLRIGSRLKFDISAVIR